MADSCQHDGLSIRVLGDLQLSARIPRHDLVRDPTVGAEAANLFKVHVVQFLEELCLLVFCELRQEVRHETWIPQQCMELQLSGVPRRMLCEIDESVLLANGVRAIVLHRQTAAKLKI